MDQSLNANKMQQSEDLNCMKYATMEIFRVPALLTPPSVSLNDAARGLALQMVFWGHDVRHPEGNALVRFGLSRNLSPGLAGTSCYRMEWESGLIELHGSIASWTSPPGGTGSVFCRDRGRIELWCGTWPPVPGHEYGESGPPAERWQAFQPFLRWLVTYENQVTGLLGADWRPGCWRVIKRLPKGKPWLPPALALKWWELAASGNPPRPKELLKT